MKSLFAKYAVLDEVVHRIKEDDNYYWKIKPATSGDDLARQKFMYQERVRYVGTEAREFPLTSREIAHRELAITFAGTNIPADVNIPVEDGGLPLISVDDSIEERERKIGEMPPNLVDELWYALGESVPGWGALPKKKTEKPTS
ncbi:MAG: hypothetical protein KQI81_08980 [Deltaproteobacteria bacterium]|nr:hypothetical protein [Deltaproteobacteria bacterium]